MGKKVEVIASHPVDEHEVGDRWEEDPVRAKAIVRSGHATYATKKDAKAAGGDKNQASTATTPRG